jgi:hypothetical protein
MVGVRPRQSPSFGGTITSTYKLSEHLPGYTGFIPKLQNSFAHTYTASTRISMSCPPTPDIQTVNYDFSAGRRSLRTASPVLGMFPNQERTKKEHTLFLVSHMRSYASTMPVSVGWHCLAAISRLSFSNAKEPERK